MARHLIAIVDDIHASATSLTVRSMDVKDYEQAVADGLDGGDLAGLLISSDAPVGLDDASIEAATDLVTDLMLLAGDQWATILRIATDHANHERRQRGGNA